MSPPVPITLKITFLKQLPSYPNSDILKGIAERGAQKLFNGVKEEIYMVGKVPQRRDYNKGIGNMDNACKVLSMMPSRY